MNTVRAAPVRVMPPATETATPGVVYLFIEVAV
jgi:hypothetical protein